MPTQLCDFFSSHAAELDFGTATTQEIAALLPSADMSALNVSWLPMAARAYQISSDLHDYLIFPVVSIVSDIPNTNGDSVSTTELLRFNTDYGMPSYATFRAKPIFVEHQNNDKPELAKGVILDVYLKPLPTFVGNHTKVIKLLAVDRTKDPQLCEKISAKQVNTTSMGMYYSSYTCSICGNTVGKGSGKLCEHTQPKRKLYRDTGNRLAYRICHNIVGFECSVLATYNDPAYVNSIFDHDHILYGK